MAQMGLVLAIGEKASPDKERVTTGIDCWTNRWTTHGIMGSALSYGAMQEDSDVPFQHCTRRPAMVR